MRADEVKKLLKVQPFAPIRISLSDGRSLLVRHPDQVVVANRHLIVGLARMERDGRLATPGSSDAVARDWLLVNLVQVTTIEPVNGARPKPRRKRRGGR
ncbi:MAG TPA: hypothetical protein VGM03_05930 [Phycisphaerae bacterium]|jgi:hypothetical protein